VCPPPRFVRCRQPSPLCVVALASGLRLSLGEVAVDGKSNEITAVPKLLAAGVNAVVTLDAMHCQKDTLAAIRAKGADYLVPVKDNQPKLYGLVLEAFWPTVRTTFRPAK
jgi:hypothetical protein